jgi:hypothetical protein
MTGLRRRLDLLEAHHWLARLDARVKQAPGQLALELGGKGKGQPCGQGWIPANKVCRIGGEGQEGKKPLHPLFEEARRRKAALEQAAASGPAPAAAAGAFAISLEDGEPRLAGRAPTRKLGTGAFGTTYQFDTPEGPVVVKVNSLKMGDPAETDPGVGLSQQRENVARREFANLKKAHAAGLAPEPIGEVTQLEDGRWSLGYRMLQGSKLTEDHRTIELTPEAAKTLKDPQAASRYVSGAIQIARRQADSGIIHGDLHGGNILVSPDGTPRLVDWAMTNQAGNPWNLPQRSAAQRAMDEGYGLTPLLTAASGSPALLDAAQTVARFTYPWEERARNAERAFKAVIDAHDFEWEDKNADREFGPNEFRDLMVKANRIKREEGVPYELALRDPRVGLEAPLTTEVLARAAAARDALFGHSDLDEMRQAIDRRFGAVRREL